MTAGPAFVHNGRVDLLAVNPLARALYKELYEVPGQSPNIARHAFLGERAQDFYPRLGRRRRHYGGDPATEAGRDPHNEELHDLIAELSTRSTEFRTRWGAHRVRHHWSGSKAFRYPVVGGDDARVRATGDGSRTRPDLTIYTAEPGSSSEGAIRLLASRQRATLPGAIRASLTRLVRLFLSTLRMRIKMSKN